MCYRVWTHFVLGVASPKCDNQELLQILPEVPWWGLPPHPPLRTSEAEGHWLKLTAEARARGASPHSSLGTCHLSPPSLFPLPPPRLAPAHPSPLASNPPSSQSPYTTFPTSPVNLSCRFSLSFGIICFMSGFPGGTSGKESTCQCRRYKRRGFDPWVGKIPWRRVWQRTPVFLPENPMDRGAWWTTIHGVTELYMTEVT